MLVSFDVDEALILSFLLFDRLEEEGSYEVAAGWAFFHGELDLAIEVLSRGGKIIQVNLL